MILIQERVGFIRTQKFMKKIKKSMKKIKNYEGKYYFKFLVLLCYVTVAS